MEMTLNGWLAKNNQGRISTLPQLGIIVQHATFSMYQFLVDKGGLDRDSPFQVQRSSFYSMLENDDLSPMEPNIGRIGQYVKVFELTDVRNPGMSWDVKYG